LARPWQRLWKVFLQSGDPCSASIAGDRLTGCTKLADRGHISSISGRGLGEKATGSSKALGCHSLVQEFDLSAAKPERKDLHSASPQAAVARIPRQLWTEKFGVVCLLYATFAA
jgi:hypothetical protein